MLIDYADTYPNNIIKYHADNMVLHVDSDAAYLIMTKERSFYAGNVYLCDWP